MNVKFLIIANFFCEQTAHGLRCFNSLGLLLSRMIPNTTINNAEAGYDPHLTAVPIEIKTHAGSNQSSLALSHPNVR